MTTSAPLDLDSLPVVATATTAKPAKPAKRDKEADRDYARAMGIRDASMRFRLISLCRYYTLDEVIEAWWKAQVTP